MKSLFLMLVTLGLSSCNPAAKAGDLFIKDLKNKVSIGDYINVSEIHSGDWSSVCVLPSVSTGGHVNEAMIRQRFNISENTDLNFPNGIVSSSDWNWALIFYSPPNTFEFLYIDNDDLHGNSSYANEQPYIINCLNRDSASFIRWKNFLQGKEWESLILTQSENIEQKISKMSELRNKRISEFQTHE